MGLIALVYVFSNVDARRRVRLVFATGTAVAAWINFGAPDLLRRVSAGLRLLQGTLQNLGPPISSHVVRDTTDRSCFGLIVFGVVEHVVGGRFARRIECMRGWPTSSDLWLHSPRGVTASGRSGDVDARRQLISQQVTDVQGFIESSKFEARRGRSGYRSPAAGPAMPRRLPCAARYCPRRGISHPASGRCGCREDSRDQEARRSSTHSRIASNRVGGVREAGQRVARRLERSITVYVAAAGETCAGALGLYREPRHRVNRLASSGGRSLPTAAHSIGPVEPVAPMPIFGHLVVAGRLHRGLSPCSWRTRPAVPMLLGAGALSGTGHMTWRSSIVAATTATLAADVPGIRSAVRRALERLRRLSRFSLDPDSLIRNVKERFAAHRTSYLIVAKSCPA